MAIFLRLKLKGIKSSESHPESASLGAQKAQSRFLSVAFFACARASHSLQKPPGIKRIGLAFFYD